MRYETFHERVIRSCEVATADGFRIKRYTIARRGELFDAARFREAEDGLIAQLPPVKIARGRPGAAFLILHQGLSGDYAVLSWWDRQNELPTRVWTRHAGVWMAAPDDQSFCVWDLEIMWFERNAWIETALSGVPLEVSLPEYLARTYSSAER